jgi:hypothetical protein
VFGLGFATVLTLVVTPAALMGFENMRLWRIRTVARLRGLFARRRVAGLWRRVRSRSESCRDAPCAALPKWAN